MNFWHIIYHNIRYILAFDKYLSVWFNENFGWQCEWVYFIWKVICYKRQKSICYLNTSILTSLWTRRWEWNRKGKSVNKEGMCDTSHLFIKFHYVIFCKYRFIRLFLIFRIIYIYIYIYIKNIISHACRGHDLLHLRYQIIN